MIRFELWLSRALVVLATLAVACTESPQAPADYDAFVVPDPEPTGAFGAWSVSLMRAEVAFGPVYFCAAASGSSTACETSIAEVTSVVRVDALAAEPRRLGTVHGFTGSIRSASYDYGISWFDTQNDPTPANVAPGGHSAHIEGEATNGTLVLPIVADVDVTPQYQGQTGIPTAPASATIDSSSFRLEVRLHAVDWFAQVDFDAIAATGVSDVQIEPGSREHDALLVGMKILAPAEFEWRRLGR